MVAVGQPLEAAPPPLTLNIPHKRLVCTRYVKLPRAGSRNNPQIIMLIDKQIQYLHTHHTRYIIYAYIHIYVYIYMYVHYRFCSYSHCLYQWTMIVLVFTECKFFLLQPLKLCLNVCPIIFPKIKMIINNFNVLN